MKRLLVQGATAADEPWESRVRVRHAALILAKGAIRAEKAEEVSEGRREISADVEARKSSRKR